MTTLFTWRDIIINSKNHFSTQNTWEMFPCCKPNFSLKNQPIPKGSQIQFSKEKYKQPVNRGRRFLIAHKQMVFKQGTILHLENGQKLKKEY